MERIERGTLILVAITLAIGFALWQALSAVGYLMSELLIDLWSQGEEVFIAEFSIGGADVRYGQLLAAVITLLLAVLIGVLLIRRIARPRPNGTPTA